MWPRGGGGLPRAGRGSPSLQHPDLRFWPPQLGDETFLLHVTLEMSVPLEIPI